MNSRRLTSEAIASIEQQASDPSLELQAKKIQTLLEENEKLGASILSEQSRTVQLEAQLKVLITEVAELRQINEQAKPWHELGVSLIAQTPHEGAQLVGIWKSHYAAMQSPGHKAVTSIGKLLGQNWVGTKIRRALAWFAALRQA